MGGSQTDYAQATGQATPDPMATMGQRQQAPAQGIAFNKMDPWNVESSHPEQIAQGLERGVQSGVGIGSGMKGKKGKKPDDGQQMVDEYGYPYSLDSNGSPVYDIGSRQVS